MQSGVWSVVLTNQFETVPVEEPLTGLGVATYVIQVVDSFGCLSLWGQESSLRFQNRQRWAPMSEK